MLPAGARAAGFPRTGREIPLQAPITEEQIRALKVGDVVLISGRMFTGRDAVHAHLMKHEPPVDLHGAVLYHCGPVVVKDAREGEGWKVTAAGPTTSIREEPYQAEIIKRYGVRAVIGKGGMGAKTLAGLKESGAVYLNAIGGAAQFYARCIERVAGVSLLEFGTPEAMWHLDVRDFPGDRHHGLPRQQPAQGRRGEVGTVLETLRGVTANRDRDPSVAALPRTGRSSMLRRVRRVLDVDPHGAPVVRFERLGVAERLRALQRPRTCSPPPESRSRVSSSAVSTNASAVFGPPLWYCPVECR